MPNHRQRTRPTRNETRERILEGAAAAFAERGFHGASQDDICARVGLTRGALTSSFASKDELFLALYDRMIEHVRLRFEDALQTIAAKGEHGMAPFLREFVTLYPIDRNWHLLSTEFALYAIRHPAAAEALSARRAALLETLARGISDVLADDGRILTVDPQGFARLWLAMHDGNLSQSLIEPDVLAPGDFFTTFGAGLVERFSEARE